MWQDAPGFFQSPGKLFLHRFLRPRQAPWHRACCRNGVSEPNQRLRKGGNDESPCKRSGRRAGGHRGHLLGLCAIGHTGGLSLAFERGVRATDINVDTDRGTVTLEGEVGTQAERQLAVKVAEDVEGVKEVVNRIHVRG